MSWSSRSTKASARHVAGFTLVEVVVGMVLLASLLVGVLLAVGRHNRLIELAKDRHEAVRIADTMLGAWSDGQEGVPLNGRGPILAKPGWFWRTSLVSNQLVFGMAIPVVALEIVHVRQNANDVLLVRVETLATRSSGWKVGREVGRGVGL